MKVTVDISNSKIAGLEAIKRKVDILSYTDNLQEEYFLIPFTILHFDANGEYIGSIVPDIQRNIFTDNNTIITVNPETGAPSQEEGSVPMGQYNFFKKLQKVVANEDILRQQMAILDTRNYFDS